jgi:hypothetical protein
MRSLGTAVLLGVFLSSACTRSEPLELAGTEQALANDDRGFVPGNVRGRPMTVESGRLLHVGAPDPCVAAFDSLDQRLGSEHARLFAHPLSAELADELARVELAITEQAPPAPKLLEATQETIAHTQWSVLGDLADADIQALAFLVLMQASKSAQEDLEAIMANVKAINSEKAKLRALLAARTGAQRGWAGCERLPADTSFDETLSPADRLLFTLSLDRLAALLAALDDGLPEVERIRPELLDELD